MFSLSPTQKIMSSYLNPYQTAILQEMGICVWQSQSVLNKAVKPESADNSPANQSREAVSASSGVAPPAASSRDRIAQLRSMLGNKDEKKTDNTPQAEHVSSSADVQHQNSQIGAEIVEPKKPHAEPIDPRSFGQMGRDILLALSLFHDVKHVRWQYADELSLKDNVLSLPYKTAPTHADDKRRLWDVISAR